MGDPQDRIKVERIHSQSNRDVADSLRAMADMVEAKPDLVSAWAVTIVIAGGRAGSTFSGPAELALAGALEVTKFRILEEFGS